MEETYRRLLCQEIGKYVLTAVGEAIFESEIESSAISALKKIQDIILNESDQGYKILQIEDVLLDYNLAVNPEND